MRFWLLVAMMEICASPALAGGPFGIEMGSPISELDVVKIEPKAELRTVPKPHADFDSYYAWNSEVTGVCVVMAISRLFEDDRSGRLVRDSAQDFADALDEKYGSRSTYDSYLGGIWEDPEDWVMSIKQNERIFAFAWENPPSNTDHIAHVELQVVALSSDTAFIKLFYQSDRFDECEKSIDAASNSSF